MMLRRQHTAGVVIGLAALVGDAECGVVPANGVIDVRVLVLGHVAGDRSHHALRATRSGEESL